MKKIYFFVCSSFLLLLIWVTFLSDDSFKEKKTNIIQQANDFDVSKLLVFKKSHVKNLKNEYEISIYNPDTLLYTDSFLFEGSQMNALGLAAFIYYGNIEGSLATDLGERFEKTVFKDTEAYYRKEENYFEALNNYYVSEELYFIKDKVKYHIAWGYLYDGKSKNKKDFFKYLDENLVSITK